MNKLILEHLDETRNNLIKEITSLNDVQFNSKPNTHSWSIAQVCHHLVLVEKASIQAIAWGLKAGNNTLKEHKKDHLKLLDRTKKLIAPKIVEPDVEPFEVQKIMELLNDSRKHLITFLGTIKDKSILAEKSVEHPAFGELSLIQWIEQIYLHEQRHIEQIKEIKLQLAAKE